MNTRTKVDSLGICCNLTSYRLVQFLVTTRSLNQWRDRSVLYHYETHCSVTLAWLHQQQLRSVSNVHSSHFTASALLKQGTLPTSHAPRNYRTTRRNDCVGLHNKCKHRVVCQGLTKFYLRNIMGVILAM